MSKIQRKWNIATDWIIAINDYRVRLSPDCPKYILDYPFKIGSNVNLGGMGFGYKRTDDGKGF